MSGARFYVFGAFLALLLCCYGFLAEAQLTSPDEVTALQAIKKKLVDPYRNLRNWNRGDPCTPNWAGVLCNFSADDGYLHVQELQLLNLNLSGSLAPEIGQLSHMKILNVMWNNISGNIPGEIGNITSLFLLLSVAAAHVDSVVHGRRDSIADA